MGVCVLVLVCEGVLVAVAPCVSVCDGVLVDVGDCVGVCVCDFVLV